MTVCTTDDDDVLLPWEATFKQLLGRIWRGGEDLQRMECSRLLTDIKGGIKSGCIYRLFLTVDKVVERWNIEKDFIFSGRNMGECVRYYRRDP
jgi:hypothetical protein